MDRLRQISQQLTPVQDWPEFNAGDTVKISYKIKEGSKERTQVFQGTVIQRRGVGATETFTVRKMASGVGVERVFPFGSPFLEGIDQDVRRTVILKYPLVQAPHHIGTA